MGHTAMREEAGEIGRPRIMFLDYLIRKGTLRAGDAEVVRDISWSVTRKLLRSC